ncbi:MAG: outer membrane beta-barrel protein [Pseudomonadales bacterium]
MNKILIALFAGASVVAASTSIAADGSFYAGLGVGQTKVKDFDPSFDAVPQDSEEAYFKYDDKDTSYNLFVGYRFNPYFALEGSYVNLGEITATADDGYEFGSLNIESHGLAASVLGSLPIGDAFSLYARLGAYYGETEASTVYRYMDDEPESDSEKEKDTAILGGVGAAYAFNERFALRAEYNRYFDVQAPQGLESDIDVISLSAVFSF